MGAESLQLDISKITPLTSFIEEALGDEFTPAVVARVQFDTPLLEGLAKANRLYSSQFYHRMPFSEKGERQFLDGSKYRYPERMSDKFTPILLPQMRKAKVLGSTATISQHGLVGLTYTLGARIKRHLLYAECIYIDVPEFFGSIPQRSDMNWLIGAQLESLKACSEYSELISRRTIIPLPLDLITLRSDIDDPTVVHHGEFELLEEHFELFTEIRDSPYCSGLNVSDQEIFNVCLRQWDRADKGNFYNESFKSPKDARIYSALLTVAFGASSKVTQDTIFDAILEVAGTIDVDALTFDDIRHIRQDGRAFQIWRTGLSEILKGVSESILLGHDPEREFLERTADYKNEFSTAFEKEFGLGVTSELISMTKSTLFGLVFGGISGDVASQGVAGPAVAGAVFGALQSLKETFLKGYFDAETYGTRKSISSHCLAIGG